MRLITAFLIVLFIVPIAIAQDPGYSSNKKAKKLYDAGIVLFNQRDYQGAIATFNQAIEKDPLYAGAYMMIGTVHIEQNHLEEAVVAFKKAVELNHRIFDGVYYDLGAISLKLGKYGEAKKYLEIYLNEFKGNSKMRIEAENMLDNIYYALEAIKHPVPFQPENLGPNINTRFHDYSPFITADGKYLYYSQTIDDQRNPFGQQEDIYVSKWNGKEWSMSRNIGMPVNTYRNEGAPVVSPDGTFMIISACEELDGYGPKRKGYGSCDLFVSFKNGNKWGEPRNLGPKINSKNWDGQASMSSDGRTLYFSSSRPGGRGDADLYAITLTDSGWSDPQNLGFHINTSKKEMGVFIHPDNQTLYFTSNGHIGMGGYDIYMSRKNEKGEWGTPINLGYPINTFQDEMSFYVDPKGHLAYITSDRDGGVGSEDLYMFEIPTAYAPKAITHLQGKVFDKETRDPLNAKFELIDIETGEVVVESHANPGNGEFLVVLIEGRDYALNVSQDGYLFHSESFTMKSAESVKEVYKKNVPLTKIKVGAPVVLKNVFFDTDKYDLKPASHAELDKLVAFLKQNETLKIELSGHTDNQGNSSDNQVLSENRAKAVLDYLVSKGIKADRLTSKGYGDSQPIADNNTPEGRAQNRRTAFKIFELE